MKVLEAEEELKAGVSDDRVYDVVLAASGSEERAAASLSARIMSRLRQNEKPEV